MNDSSDTCIKTTVYQSVSRFDMAGQKLPSSLHEIPEQITPGLAARLLRYATQRLNSAGFYEPVGWEPSVYSVDADRKPADRSYCVRFQNETGGFIELAGILTRSGWPCLDHGFYVGEEY